VLTHPLELWGGHECTVNRIGDVWRDQTRLSGHQDRIDDLDLFADLGLNTLRYPVLWERTEVSPGVFDWSWPDARMERLRDRGVKPILGLLHHGSGPGWTDLLDPDFPEKFAAFARAVARRYPWVDDWTPINEPLTTARFSCLYGLWYPHLRSERDFWRALGRQLAGVRSAMREIRAVNPAARLVQTEDFGRTWGTGPCLDQAVYENRRRLAAWDGLTGRMTPDHPLMPDLRRLGVEGPFASLADEPCPPQVLGFNHYVTSDRFLDHRLEHYPSHAHGGNGALAYADVEAVRIVDDLPKPWLDGFRLLWERYGIPIAATECHLACTPGDQIEWLGACWSAALAARAEGIPVLAVTPWALLGSYDWDSLLTAFGHAYEPGVFDLSSGTPKPTPLAALVRQLGRDGRATAEAGKVEGWWRSPDRLIYPAWSVGAASPRLGSP